MTYQKEKGDAITASGEEVVARKCPVTSRPLSFGSGYLKMGERTKESRHLNLDVNSLVTRKEQSLSLRGLASPPLAIWVGVF